MVGTVGLSLPTIPTILMNIVHLTPDESAPFVNPADVHVYAVNMDALQGEQARFAATLSADERARAAKFRFAHLRERFIVRRGLLRRLLAHYISTSPAAIVYTHGTHGKPALAPGMCPPGFVFNVSHSDEYVLFGFTHAAAVGVDIEKPTPIADMLLVAKHHFSHAEQQTLFSLPEDERIVAFYHTWTRKEAIVKAIGNGITYPLSSFTVTMRQDEPASLLHADDPDLLAYQLANIPVDGPCIAACAVQRP
ncbi:MAG: 4'-phosphopantetheinyl transferase superfamily protein [Chloroflexota bacterium]